MIQSVFHSFVYLKEQHLEFLARPPREVSNILKYIDFNCKFIFQWNKLLFTLTISIIDYGITHKQPSVI